MVDAGMTEHDGSIQCMQGQIGEPWLESAILILTALENMKLTEFTAMENFKDIIPGKFFGN